MKVPGLPAGLTRGGLDDIREGRGAPSLPNRLRAMADAVEPVICLGDEDSAFLTPRQIGYQEGLRAAADLIESENP